MKKSEVYI